MNWEEDARKLTPDSRNPGVDGGEGESGVCMGVGGGGVSVGGGVSGVVHRWVGRVSGGRGAHFQSIGE